MKVTSIIPADAASPRTAANWTFAAEILKDAMIEVVDELSAMGVFGQMIAKKVLEEGDQSIEITALARSIGSMSSSVHEGLNRNLEFARTEAVRAAKEVNHG